MTNRFRLTFAALVAAAALLAAGPAGPASAQEGEGEIELEAVHPAGQSLHFIVRVTEGGDPANDASVTAAAVSVSGESLSPVDLTRDDDDGRYSGPVEFPSAGLWTVRFTSTNPDATLEVDQEVELSPSTTAGGGDQGTGGTEGSTDATAGTTEGGFAPEDDGTGDSAQAADEGDEDEDGLPVWLIVLAAVVVIGGVLAALALRSRPPASPGDGTGGEGGDESEPEPAAGPPGSGTR
jgi:YtkA-like